MKIAFYIHHTSLKAGGIFTYSVGILRMLMNLKEIEKIFLIISSDQKNYFENYMNSPKLQIVVINRKNLWIKITFTLTYSLFNIIALYRNFFGKQNHLKLLSKLSALLNPYGKIINSLQVDLAHIPSQYAPIYNADVPLIITMHDIQEYHYPDYFSVIQKLHRRMNNITALNESTHTIVSFDHIKQDLIRYLEVQESKISVCPPPFTENWFLTKKCTSEKILREKFQIEKRFILYPAATWKHKNHITLFKAISLLNMEGLKIQLICTGNKTEYFLYLQKQIADLNLSDQIKFLGIIPEKDLIGLYKCTSLVVIPTKYEAGSGPLYEAMRYSVPVICSNVTSLPETMSNAKYIFIPDDEKEIANKIKRMIQDETYRSENLANSAKRVNEMSKMNYAKNFIDVYRQLLGESNK